MADLFISYSRKDIAYARLLHKALSEHDLEAWVDWQDIPPSTEWLQEVYAAIEAAHTFIFLLSDSSTISEICSLEIEHAKKNNKRIIPIVINEVEPSQVHPALAAINWIFSRSQDELQPAIAALIEAIQTDYDWVKAHTRLQVRALEWERAGQDKSFLLQGTDLRQAEDWLAEAPALPLPPTDVPTIAPAPTSLPEGWAIYRNETEGFEIAYPTSFTPLDDANNLYGWINGVLLLYNGGQSYDIVVQIWDSQAEYESALGSDLSRVTIFPSGDRFFTVMDITQEPESPAVIATFRLIS